MSLRNISAPSSGPKSKRNRNQQDIASACYLRLAGLAYFFGPKDGDSTSSETKVNFSQSTRSHTL
jgi:hypothetical protein